MFATPHFKNLVKSSVPSSLNVNFSYARDKISVAEQTISKCIFQLLRTSVLGSFSMCAEHGTNLAGVSPVTGIYRQV